MKILILGGYGTFGGRLAQLLAGNDQLTLIIAGRSIEQATRFSRELPLGAHKVPALFDRNENILNQIEAIAPDLVVDATGPFQNYGDDPYRVVRACIAFGCDYMDLADGSDFVKGIGQFNDEAKNRNIYVLSGVSSFPVLTAAVVRRLAQGLTRINSITGGIAPSPYAGVGLNVIRAITSYSGKPVALVRNSQKTVGYALTETMRYTIGPPGRLPLRNIRFSLVDVPDLQALPALWPDINSIWMGAGPVPEILHTMLNGLAWLVRWKFIPSLLPFAKLFYNVMNNVRWGEHRGGMFVSITGIDEAGATIERSWHLLAEGNDGPFIPSMAIEAIVYKCLSTNKPAAGARPATNELELEDYDTLFKTRMIFTGQRETVSPKIREPLYKRLLGDAWTALPPSLMTLHSCDRILKAQGLANVERGSSLLARFTANLIGFPKGGTNVPLQVSFKMKDGGELWTRTFAGRSFSSFQSEGAGRSDRLLSEQFGPLTFDLALVLDANKLRLIVRRWRFLRIPLPAFLAPTGDSYEFEEDGRFHFNVEIKHALTGLIARYRGWLVLV